MVSTVVLQEVTPSPHPDPNPNPNPNQHRVLQAKCSMVRGLKLGIPDPNLNTSPNPEVSLITNPICTIIPQKARCSRVCGLKIGIQVCEEMHRILILVALS